MPGTVYYYLYTLILSMTSAEDVWEHCMNRYAVLKDCPLFSGINETDVTALLACLNARRQSAKKDEYIFLAGDKPSSVGIVLSGSVRVLQEDYFGRRSILSHVSPGGLFAESFTCAGKDELPVSIVSAESSEIMTIDYRKIVTSCTSACSFHTRLIMNMMSILAEKNIQLTKKVGHLSRGTIRDKLISFLADQAASENSSKITIPFNKTELAEYLCVDRSAMSRELCSMQKQGILSCSKNSYELLKKPEG